MVWAALGLALLSWPLQVFSHATTCNNGDYSAFMAGSIITTPLLLGMAVLLLRARKSSSLSIAAVVGIMVFILSMVLIDSDIVVNTLVHGTPCGPDYVDAFAQVEPLHRLLIVFAYLVMPVINILLAGLFIWRSSRAAQRRDLSV